MHPLLAQNERLKREADSLLLQNGVLAHLQQFGVPHVTGSYALDLMTWRDLDIYLQTDTITESAFFQLGAGLAERLQPLKMSYRNELRAQTPALPAGRYWGIYLGDERQGAWKVDVWVVGQQECQRLLAFVANIIRKLTPEAALRILQIKTACWQHSAYRRSFGSSDIYDAVLNAGIVDVGGFTDYLKQKNIFL